jgi:hypothetical protein
VAAVVVAVVAVPARGTVEGSLARGVVVVEGGLPGGLGVVDEGFIGEVMAGLGVLGAARRGWLISDVTFRASSESSEASLEIGCEAFCCEEELMTTAIRDGVRARVGVDGALGLKIGLGGPDDGVQLR